MLRLLRNGSMARTREPLFTVQQKTESLGSLVECCYSATTLHVKDCCLFILMGLGPEIAT